MRRLVLRSQPTVPLAQRHLTLRPEATVDSDRYPLGFVPLDGTEQINSVYALLKAGHFVAPLNDIKTIHETQLGVRSLCRSEFPVVSVQDMIAAHTKEREILSRVLIRRDYWTLDDFNDNELNTSYGVQNYYFDNYKWSQVLWKRFQIFVEEYYSVAEHTHLTYTEYTDLIRSFSAFEQGVKAAPAVPSNVRLHPPFGILPPSKFSLEPIMLLKQWVTNFKAPLMLNKALVLNAGCGATAFALKSCKVPMIRGVDPRPRAIAACRNDAQNHWMLADVSFQVAEQFPREEPHKAASGGAWQKRGKYDLIVYYPDEELVSQLSAQDDAFAPGQTSFAGKLEQFFENVSEHLTDTGVVAVCCSNLNSILRPDEPHPIEYEVKINRRFVILDYFDAPVRYKSQIRTKAGDPKLPRNAQLLEKLRSELWVLHKVDSIEHFGFIHGIPGAKPPAHARNWGKTKHMAQRQKVMREHVETMGGDWGDYKSRLITMLQEQTDEPEDDVAEAVRMSLDPTYPAELARRAQKRIEEAEHDRGDFQSRIAEEFADVSPREAFDRKYSSQN